MRFSCKINGHMVISGVDGVCKAVVINLSQTNKSSNVRRLVVVEESQARLAADRCFGHRLRRNLL